MTTDFIRSSSTGPISWREAEALAPVYGEKAARLLTLPREWVPAFIALPAETAMKLSRDAVGFSEAFERLLGEAKSLLKASERLIIRSSVPGETIWERGTYRSEVVEANAAGVIIPDNFFQATASVLASAQGRNCAMVVQSFIPPSEKGEFGNVLRVSKTRDHWELSVCIDDGLVQAERLNSQRDIAAAEGVPLLAKPGLSRERLFGSIGAWINNDLLRGVKARVNCEWVRKGNRFYLVQIDLEDEDYHGINPMQINIEKSIVRTPTSGEILKIADDDGKKTWDKLAVLDELFDDKSRITPSLYYVSARSILGRTVEELSRDFSNIFEKNIVIRTSVRRDGEKITNLPKSDCLTAIGAAQWCLSTARKLEIDYPDAEFAFVTHRYIASRSSAWARAKPDDPVVEIHGTWGLPDALQFCSYDIWDVHVPSEEITEYPSFKSDVLLLKADGSWRYERVKNDIARFQSINKDDILDIARTTKQISQKMNTSCHVMWFVGALNDVGESVNLPWYWTKAHDTENIDVGTPYVYVISSQDQLTALPDMKKKNRRLAIALRPKNIELLRDNSFLSKVANVVAPIDIPVVLSGSTLAHAFYQLRKAGCIVVPEGDRDHQRVRRQTTFGKLVRDKIPERIASHQEQQHVATIPTSARSGFLIGKFFEEVLEAREAEGEENRKLELADVYEVWRALTELFGENEASIIQEANKKREKAGGFSDGYVLLSTNLPAAGNLTTPQGSTVSYEILSEISEDGGFRLPFTFFGFSEIGQPRLLRLRDQGYDLEVTLQRDCIEFKLQKRPEQLVFEF